MRINDFDRRLRMLPGMTTEMSRAVVVQRLAASQIRSPYPLMREVFPALTLPRWLAYARPATSGTGDSRRGILVALRRNAPHPVGAVCYRRDYDISLGCVLTAEHFIAMDMLYPDAILTALLAELDTVARKLRCAAIRAVVHGARETLIHDLGRKGLLMEGTTLTKRLVPRSATGAGKRPQCVEDVRI
jgi:hypothetical protein